CIWQHRLDQGSDDGSHGSSVVRSSGTKSCRSPNGECIFQARIGAAGRSVGLCRPPYLYSRKQSRQTRPRTNNLNEVTLPLRKMSKSRAASADFELVLTAPAKLV